MNVWLPGCDGTEIPDIKSHGMGHILTCSSYVDDDLTRRKFEQADCTLFSAILCSDTSYEKLCTVAKYMFWVCSALPTNCHTF